MTVPYLSFHCHKCGACNRFQQQMIDEQDEHPVSTCMDLPVVTLSCIDCRHVDKYKIEKRQTYLGNEDMVVYLPEMPFIGFLERLKCDDRCDTVLKVFAQRKMSMTDEEKQLDISTWGWDELHCPSGHPISLPNKR